MKVHKELQTIYAKTAKSNCKTPMLNNGVCINFVGCGPENMCHRPCKKCLAWEGYGGQKVIDIIKKEPQ